MAKRHKPNSLPLNTPSSSHSAAQKPESFDQEIADLKKEINEYRDDLANASSEERKDRLLDLIETSRETLNLLLKSTSKLQYIVYMIASSITFLILLNCTSHFKLLLFYYLCVKV